MAVESAGEARAKITADTRGLKKATSEVKTAEGKIVGSLKKIEAAALMQVGQSIGRMGKQITAAFKNAVVGPTAYADAIAKMSKETGIGTTRLQEWGLAAELSGGSVADIEKSVAFLAKTLEKASLGEQTYIDLLQDYGVTATTIEEALWQINAAMSAETNATKRLGMAQELLGRGGKKLVPLFKQTRKEIEGLFAIAQAGGVIIPPEQLKAVEALQDAMTMVEKKSKAAAVVIALELGPALVAMENIEADILMGIANTLHDIGGAGEVAAFGIAGAGKAASFLGPLIQSLAMIKILTGKNIVMLTLMKAKIVAVAIASGVAAAAQWVWNAALATKMALLGAFVLVAAGVAAAIAMRAQATAAPVPAMAAGGIVTSPTLVLAGERGPEAIVPLSGGGRFGRTRITFNIYGITDPDAVAAAVAERIQ